MNANKTLGAQERDNDVTEETLTEFEKGRTLWSPTLKVLISLNKESDPTKQLNNNEAKA